MVASAPPPTPAGPSLRETGGTIYWLSEEIGASRDAVQLLDAAVSKGLSYREKSSELLEAAHRALSRLEQVGPLFFHCLCGMAGADIIKHCFMTTTHHLCAATNNTQLQIHTLLNHEQAVASNPMPSPEFIAVGCELKLACKRGLALVRKYGFQNTVMKVATLVARSYVSDKFDRVIESLQCLATADKLTAARACTEAPEPRRAGLASHSRSLATHSVPHATSFGPPQGTLIRTGKHDKIHSITYVPFEALSSNTVCVWWSVGQVTEFYSEASQSTTAFPPAESPKHVVTALGIDDDGNVWTGHHRGIVRMRKKQYWDSMLEEKIFGSLIKCIVFDELGHTWVGDEGGKIKVLLYEELEHRVTQVASLQRERDRLATRMKTGTGELLKGLTRFAFHSGGGSSATASGSSSASAGDGPIR